MRLGDDPTEYSTENETIISPIYDGGFFLFEPHSGQYFTVRRDVDSLVSNFYHLRSLRLY